MLTQIAAYLFRGRRANAEIDAAIASAIEDARESGSLSVPEDIDTLVQGTRARLLSLIQQTPKEIEVATSLLRGQIDAMQAELTELNAVAQRAEALGLLASWPVRWAVARRTRRTIRELGALRVQVLRHERTRNQLDQWLDTRVQLICSEYRRAKSRADLVTNVGGARIANANAPLPVARTLALAGLN